MSNKKNTIYNDVESNPNFSEIDKKIINYWKENKIFEKSVEFRKSKTEEKNNEFIFYDGPPFANGLPHYGHLLTGYIKDCYARYQTTKGKKVERRFGWDCHGLPAEMESEKELGISGRLSIVEHGIDKFNSHCKLSVMKYTSEWEEYVTRQARWVDFDNSYKTMDLNYMESVLWAFKELYKKGLVYESMRVMPYSWKCETPLSNFETRLDNSYRQRADKAITVSFELTTLPKILPKSCKEYRILAWTTTPWTLPSNLALAVGEELDYISVVSDDVCYIMGAFALDKYKKDLKLPENPEIIKFKGKDLIGSKYKPLFDYFSNHPNSFSIFSGDFVVEGDGTGIVHLAPGFGEDDQILCEKNGINLVCPVDNSGKFTKEVYDFAGQLVFDAIDPIIIMLKNKGNWHKTEQYLHNYPHCWRTDTPLIYKAVPSWYVEVTKFKDRMVELNQQINWIPERVKNGLFGKWLENARDWSISRNRFWGTPIPVWKSDNPQYPRIDVYGSIEELEKDFAIKIHDLHRPYIDDLIRPNPDDPSGKSMMRRVEDVFDCWFESGSMPYGQAHYPFENKKWFEEHFPADFIVEYSAQTRGWFYTLMVLSTALFDRPPFLNCICHGVILDSEGQKLSKRLRNYADPIDIFEKYGSDALRYTMLSSPVVKGQELLIDKDGKMVYDTLRLKIKPIWNSYNFFIIYANADNIKAEITYQSNNLLDKYILGKLKSSVLKIDESMTNFDTQSAYQALDDFFEVLNNWYIRRSRQRFWDSEKTEDKISAYNVLYTCLDHILKAASSLIPIISEEIYIGLNAVSNSNETKTIHLQNFPDVSNITIDNELISVMDLVRNICSSALFIRNQENVRVRQPLNSIEIFTEKNKDLEYFSDLISDELNVKNVIFRENLKDYADIKLEINFPVLGKRLPTKMKDIISASKKSDWKIVNDQTLQIAGELLSSDEFKLSLVPKDLKGAKSLDYNQGMVVLDLEITDKLTQEGYARDIIRFIQQARKDAELDVTDRISLQIHTDDNYFSEVINNFSNMITDQTLSKFDNSKDLKYSNNFDIDEKNIIIKFEVSNF